MPEFSEWPMWVKVAIVGPHALLGFVACWLWWPKSDQARRKFGFVALYLLLFYLVMHFVFGA
jgi:hypothetical protein